MSTPPALPPLTVRHSLPDTLAGCDGSVDVDAGATALSVGLMLSLIHI